MTNAISALAIALAGGIHLGLAPQHYEHSPSHGIFFLIVGIAEIGWAMAFWLKPSKFLYYAGLGLAGGLVILWAMTRFLPTPFEHSVGEVDLGGIASKISELVGLGVLLLISKQGRIVGLAKQSFARLFGVALVLSVVAGIASYSIGHAVEPLFPSLAGSEQQ